MLCGNDYDVGGTPLVNSRRGQTTTASRRYTYQRKQRGGGGGAQGQRPLAERNRQVVSRPLTNEPETDRRDSK